ncbi:MAG TPA: hypothetical protein VGR51_03340 [Thermoplasmata archaeon]|nr:hypothetical protein [Thermoplasmata archaeon]
MREQELEMRLRDLTSRGQQLREAFRRAEETSQDLMARTHALREEERAIAADRDGLYREREEVVRLRAQMESRQVEFVKREGVLADIDRRLREREAVLDRTEQGIDALRDEQQEALAAARDALVREREISGVVSSSGEQEHVTRLLQLEAALETATAFAHSREGEAQRLLREAGERGAHVQALEARIGAEEGRLVAMRAEIVNAKRALLAVDRALTRMPYEVVDDFTRSDAFEAYERAVRALKLFEDAGPG